MSTKKPYTKVIIIIVATILMGCRDAADDSANDSDSDSDSSFLISDICDECIPNDTLQGDCEPGYKCSQFLIDGEPVSRCTIDISETNDSDFISEGCPSEVQVGSFISCDNNKMKCDYTNSGTELIENSINGGITCFCTCLGSLECNYNGHE